MNKSIKLADTPKENLYEELGLESLQPRLWYRKVMFFLISSHNEILIFCFLQLLCEY